MKPVGEPDALIGHVRFKEMRVVGDEERAIVDALNALRHRFTYVFTTGGIGPTHADITADCVAKAFGVPIDIDPRALAILHEWVKTTGAEMNEARLLTRIPRRRFRPQQGVRVRDRPRIPPGLFGKARHEPLMHGTEPEHPGRGPAAPADGGHQFSEHIEVVFETAISLWLQNAE
jgi:Probable molybdopterin binding domain